MEIAYYESNYLKNGKPYTQIKTYYRKAKISEEVKNNIIFDYFKNKISKIDIQRKYKISYFKLNKILESNI